MDHNRLPTYLGVAVSPFSFRIHSSAFAAKYGHIHSQPASYLGRTSLVEFQRRLGCSLATTAEQAHLPLVHRSKLAHDFFSATWGK